MQLGLVAAAALGLGLVALAMTRPARASAASLASWREKLLACARYHASRGTLYQWGGGHGWLGAAEYGLDCSGLVLQCAKAAGIRAWLTADDMWQTLPSVDAPEPGDLALYGRPDRAWHVRIVEAWHPAEQRAEVIGSDGGGPSTTTPERARAAAAFVRSKSDHRSKSFLGFRSLSGLRTSPQVQPAVWRGAH